MAKKRKPRQQTRVFRKAKKRKPEPRIKAYHNTFQSNIEAIQKDGYIRSNAELKERGVHRSHFRTGDPSVPVTDEKHIFFYPSFAQYSSECVTYGVNNEEIRAELEAHGFWEYAKNQHFSAFVFDAEVLLLKYRGRLRIDYPGFYEGKLTGKKAVRELKKYQDFSRRYPSNSALALCEILVAGALPLEDCLEIIEDAVVDYEARQ